MTTTRHARFRRGSGCYVCIACGKRTLDSVDDAPHTRIYKYTIPLDVEAWVRMPLGAVLLAVQVQREAVCVWADVDPAAATCRRKFAVRVTGDSPAEGRYAGTVQLEGGAFHVYDCGEVLD